MRRSPIPTYLLLALSTLALTACGKGEVKTGNLTQRFNMVDDKGVHFGVVEMDPISGGRITDVQGRVVGQIVPPVNATVAQAMPAQMPVTQ
jgi:hypothetical protein